MFTMLQKTIFTLTFCLLHISMVQSMGQTMHLACINEDIEAVRELIGKKQTVNVKISLIDEQRISQPIPTPLHYAAEKGNLEIIGALVGAKAEIDSMHCEFKNTPLHVSVWHNKPNATKMLIKYGAQRNKTNSLGNTPVHVAASKGLIECLKELLSSTDLTFNYKLCTAPNKNGATPIQLAETTNSDDARECIALLQKSINDYIAHLSERNAL